MPGGLEALARSGPAATVGPCLFRRVAGGWLLTNEWGLHQRLEERDFLRFMGGELADGEPLREELRRKGFLRDRLEFAELSGRLALRTAPLRWGGTLHAVALTRRGDQATPYRAAAGPEGVAGHMSLATARRVVKFIFDGPGSEVTVQLRGGEPLLNWDVLEFFVRQARSFAASVRRTLSLGLVSNLAALDDKRLDFLAESGVALGVPLDGPAELHDRLRGGGSHAAVERGIRRWRERHPQAPPPEAFLTVTRESLGRAGDILEEYRRLGLGAIHVRAQWPDGAGRRPGEVPSAAEFLAFYRDLLGRILALEAGGTPFVERGAAALLCRVLSEEDPGQVDLGAVYGGGHRHLAYDANGDVYLSAEGLDLALLEDDLLFRLGGVDVPYQEAAAHPTVRAALLASELGGQPLCRQCAYKPFCGVSPVYNYAAQGTIHGRNPTNARCAGLMGRFDLLFELLEEPRARRVFEGWARAAAVPRGTPLPPHLTGGLL